VVLARVLLFGAPLAAGALAARRCNVSDDPARATGDRVWQVVAAGLALLRAASALYGRELDASGAVAFYAVICVIFPLIGLMMGATGSGSAKATGPRPERAAEKVSA
jgi:hypothetical protein